MRTSSIEQTNRENFRVCLDVLSRPGTSGYITSLFDSHLTAIALSLLYAEVSCCFKGMGNYDQIRAITGSPEASAAKADYIFCEHPDIDILAVAKTGTLIQPDQSAILFVQTRDKEKEATDLILKGPGIQGKRKKQLPVSPPFLHRLRQKNSTYPLGVDCFFLTEQGKLTAIARTTSLEMLS